MLENPRVKDQVSAAEWQTRIDLAACYRLMVLYGMTDLIYNHITARVPGTDAHILINPYGFLYEEITASSLLKIDLEGNVLLQPDPNFGVNLAGYVIHSAVHGARHDVSCVMHTHTRAGMAVSAMKCGLLDLTQTSMRFHGAVSYHAYEGPAIDLDERARLVADLGQNDVMILRNHGLLACGGSIAEAFNRIYFLEMACRAQVDALAAGAELELSSTAAAERTPLAFRNVATHEKSQSGTSRFDGMLEWRALRRRLDRLDPSYGE